MNAVVEVFDPAESPAEDNATQVAGSDERLVVVGNGPAGVHLVRELIRHGYPGSITVFGEEAWEPYDRVKLSSLLNGDIALAAIDNSIAAPGADRLFQHFSCRVNEISTVTREVIDQTGRRFGYDKLVLATGSKPHVPGIEGAQLKGVYCFRNLTDVQHLLARSLRSRRTVIVGGGLLGLEAAKAMQRGNTEVVLVQHSGRVMNRQLDDRAASILHAHIRSLGIRLHLNSHLTRVIGDDSAGSASYQRESQASGKPFRPGVCAVELSSGDIMECDTVIFATGIKPNIDLATGGQIAHGRGFRIDSGLATNQDNVFAIGECAEYNDQVWGLVAPGLQQAACLAKRLCGKNEEYYGSISTSRLKVLGIDVFSMGMVGDEHEKQVDKTVTWREGDSYRKLFIRRGKLVGAILVGACEQSIEIQRAVEQGTSILPWQLWRFRRTGLVWKDDSSQSIERWPATAVVCQCNGVTLADLQAVSVAGDGGGTVAELQAATRAGTTCGSCVPLLQAYAGQSVSREKQKVAGFWLVTLMVVTAMASLLLVNPLPYADSALNANWWEFFLRDSQMRQYTGFTLIGLAVLSMLVSARKRIKKFSKGKFNSWRVFHGLLGGLCLFMLWLHTGFDLGSNINSLLMTNFLALAALGATTTLVLSLVNRLPISTNNQLRKYTTWGHVVLFWPLPALLGLHILSVYFF